MLLCGPPPHFGGNFHCILNECECSFQIRMRLLLLFFLHTNTQRPYSLKSSLLFHFPIETFMQSKRDNCLQNLLTSFQSTFFISSSTMVRLRNNGKQIQGQEFTASGNSVLVMSKKTSFCSAHLVCMVHVGSDCVLIISYCEQIKLSNDRSTKAHSGVSVHAPDSWHLAPPLLLNGTCALVVIWKGYFLKPWPSVER